jgi:ADP-ribosylglycohydrolase
MRLAPVALAYRVNPERAMHYAGESSRTTHGAPAAVDACKFYAALILGALRGASSQGHPGTDRDGYLQGETVSKQRQGLLDSFEDESAVAELSKLASRVEIHGAKLDNLAGKLANAQAELKPALAAFAISCNAPFSDAADVPYSRCRPPNCRDVA